VGFRLSVVGCGLSVVSCGFSVGIRLLTVAFWVGDVVDFSVFGYPLSVVGSRLGFDCLQWLSGLGMLWTFRFSVFGCGFSVICCELWVLGWDSIAYSGFLGWGCCRVFGFRLSFRLWVVGFRLSVVSCGFSVGIRLLTVAFWVGDAVEFSVFGCGLWVFGWDSIAYSGFLNWK
jgi:hypothetical protein